MCGIFANLDSNDSENFCAIKHRGPDTTDTHETENTFLGFHRLSIMGLSKKENHIINDDNVYLLCNGEIYNYKELYKKYNLTPKTESDCEIILRLYLNYMQNNSFMSFWEPVNFFKKVILELDGDFAFVIMDYNKDIVLASRDRIGVRPLFINSNYTKFASEEKALYNPEKQFTPGTFYFKYDEFKTVEYYWRFPLTSRISYEPATKIIQNLLVKSIEKRLMSDRPIGFLLSGGLDSSIIACLSSKLLNKKITTFSIGYENSPDLIAARKVAEFIDSDHHEVIMTDEDIKNNLEQLIYCLGSFDITTVRASMPMYLLSAYISNNTPIKVLFSGEGADELFAGYLYLHKAPSYSSLDTELKSLVKNLHLFDCRRADRTTARWGLELRVPFLDADFIDFAMGLDPSIKMGGNRIEKAVLRDSVIDLIPEDIRIRRKEAFSDGVGSRSVEYLKSLAEGLETYSETETEKAIPETKEAKMYYIIFKNFYKDFNDTYFYWMPKWSNTKDPSATTLENY